MVQVTLRRLGKAGGPIVQFEVSGHAGYADEGEDIVCAAVSVLTTTIVRGVQQQLGLAEHVTATDQSGLLRFHLHWTALNPDMQTRSQDLLETMAFGLKRIAQQYREHVSVREVIQ